MAKVRVLPIYEKQARFRKSKAKLKGFIGGRGCVAPETKIRGVPIAEIGTSTRLATLFGSQESLPPFLKGKAELYRVRTESGLEVVVTDAHRFLTPFGWLRLIDLRCGSLIATGDESCESYMKETGRDWKDRYCLGSRLSDELSSPREVAFREILQRFCSTRSDFGQHQNDRLSTADSYVRKLCQSFAGHLGPLTFSERFHLGSSLRHLKSLLSDCTSDQLGTSQSYGVHQSELQCDDRQAACLLASSECLQFAFDSEQTSHCNRAPGLSVVSSCLDQLNRELAGSESLSLSAWDSIQSITWERTGEFWDLHVPVQNHYSAHGIWHHNTGKTHIGAQDVAMEAKAGEPWVCVSPDNNVIRETTFPTVLDILRKTGQYIKDVMSPMPRITFHTRDGGIATLVFRSGEAPEKLRGGNYAGAWLDEATVMPQAVYDLIRPTLRWRGKMGPTLITATPKGTKHWTFSKFYEQVDRTSIGNDGATADGIEWINGLPYRRRDGTYLVKASTRDNPFLPPDFYHAIRNDYGSMLAAQELEGDFVEIAGLMFRREWFPFVNHAPNDCVRVRYWDQAATPGSGCYTAGLLLALDEWGVYYIEHVIRGQWGPLERNRIIDQVTEADSRRYHGAVLTYVEQEGGSGGKEIASQMVSRLAGHAVFKDIVSGKRERVSGGEKLPGEAKVVRAMGAAAASENGNVRIVRGNWNEDFISELAAFPEYKFCDQVDAFSGAFNRLAANAVPINAGSNYRLPNSPVAAPAFGALATLQQMKGNSRWSQMPWAQENSDG